MTKTTDTDTKVPRVVAPLPANESLRLEALYRLRILDTPREADFDHFTSLAASICEVPMSTVTFIDAHRQWFKSAVGMDSCETGRDISFCAYAILESDVLIIRDAQQDPRVRDNANVTGPPGIRSYAGVPLSTENGHVVGTLCVLDTKPRDLNPRQLSMLRELAAILVRQLEQRLLRQQVTASEKQRLIGEKSYAEIVASLREVVFQIGGDGRWSFLNPAWKRLTGHPIAETIGREWLDFVLPEDRALASRALATCHENGDQHRPVIRLLDSNGASLQMEMAVLPSTDAGFTGTLYDLSERLQAEAAVREAQLRAEKATRAKADFLSRMSHEIRTPMNALLGFSELLMETSLNERQRSYVQVFHANAQRLLALVNDILDLSKLQAGQMKVNVARFNPAAIATEVAILLRGSAIKKVLPIYLDFETEVDTILDGLAATRQIREWEQTRPLSPVLIVALTANEIGEERRRLLLADYDAYLTKPISKQKLLDTIFGLLEVNSATAAQGPSRSKLSEFTA